jgi:hypothetical protein
MQQINICCIFNSDSYKECIAMGTGHFVLGETIDYITGRTIPDTHDERIRQTIAKLLVDVKGYSKTDILIQKELVLSVDQKTGFIHVDFMIRLDNRTCMIVMYGPGSLVTRQRPTLATARLIDDHIVPFSIITNGIDAIIMDSASGSIIGEGLESIPNKIQLSERINKMSEQRISTEQREMEKRILFAMEVLTQQECSEFTCAL